MRDALKIYVPIVLLVVAGFAVTYQFVDPAPPKAITIAAGSPDGAYADFAERYAQILARAGVTVNRRPTAGAMENIQLLNDPGSGVDAAFVQGGVGDPFGAPALVSLGSLFHEPLWVFVRAASAPDRLAALKGKKIAIGAPGSGTRVLAKALLVASGVDDDNSSFVSIGGAEAARALESGEVDTGFFVAARISPAMDGLIRNPAIRIMTFTHAEAYERLYGYLSTVTVPRGALSLERDLPPRPLDLVAPTAALVVRDDLHPAIVDLLLSAATEVHQPGSLFSPLGTFPSPNFVDFPLSEDARRYFKSGPTFLRRVLPFWAAVMVERLLIMLVPLITVMIPLFKLAPPAYRWGVRRKIYRWYRELRDIEAAARSNDAPEGRARLAERLDRIQTQVGRLRVPLSYAEQLYQLRLHIAFMKQLLG